MKTEEYKAKFKREFIFDPHKMDKYLWENGEVVGIYTFPKDLLNMIMMNYSLMGYVIDFHYAVGRAVVKTAPKTDEFTMRGYKKVLNTFQSLYDMKNNWEEENGVKYD